MEKITYINSKGRKIVLGDAAPYILTKIDGLGAANANIQSQKSPNQDGESYIGLTLQSRSMAIEIMVVAESEDEMTRYREAALQVFNPKLGPGTLVYTIGDKERRISAISELAPSFPDAQDFKDTMQPGLIQLYCPDPFFQDATELKQEVAIWRGAFEFPLEIPEEGIELGYREPSLIVNLHNGGDVPCGMRIQFKALATVVNPSLFNVSSREYFKLNRTMEAGEIVTVTTHFQNKRVELFKSGVTSNAFNWIDLQSTFLQLDPGDNLLRYDADSGLDNLEVSIWYTPQYLGV